MANCERSGFCCKQGVCPFGTWDKEKHQCAHLVGESAGEYECGIYEQIIKHPSSEFSPAFGAGCSSALNPDRMRLFQIKKNKLNM
jgi:hypothetical protein